MNPISPIRSRALALVILLLFPGFSRGHFVFDLIDGDTTPGDDIHSFDDNALSIWDALPDAGFPGSADGSGYQLELISSRTTAGDTAFLADPLATDVDRGRIRYVLGAAILPGETLTLTYQFRNQGTLGLETWSSGGPSPPSVNKEGKLSFRDFNGDMNGLTSASVYGTVALFNAGGNTVESLLLAGDWDSGQSDLTTPPDAYNVGTFNATGNGFTATPPASNGLVFAPVDDFDRLNVEAEIGSIVINISAGADTIPAGTIFQHTLDGAFLGTPVPEPSSFLLTALAAGFGILAVRRKRPAN